MKTKKLLQGFLIVACTCAIRPSNAQDVSINITPLQTEILNKTIGEVEVVICNEDPDPITAPANNLRPLISFSDNLTITEVVNPDGSPLTNFTIQELTNDPENHNLRLLYTADLANPECVTFRIRFQGNTVGNGFITSTLGFENGQLPGNDPSNDNSGTTTLVLVNLPVTLKEFNAEAEGKVTQLNWATTEETNSDHFDVQRSQDGKHWTTFQTVAAQGESTVLKTYEAVDNDPFNGENLYRLHMIDKDGTSAYSSIRNVKFEFEPTVLFPNPASDYVTIKAVDWAKVKEVEIMDANGREVYHSGNKPVAKLNVTAFAAGIYTVHVKATNGAVNKYKIAVAR
ncbi:T9SS type A sorting domain-containing protein [Dyadobacter arcticus]|uniref:Secretion system C-terminal sorting domain-containing protein n=1 Tax=Dyadobacter arcticus TaxID=1078754 RepID=A0ABX0UKT3_9BACT|nr:T9SS type A sorting domain-containing protein [Dyadobacter arcticus]NIJ53628.1 hypothetical protein [Dyadobacter arcticus]